MRRLKTVVSVVFFLFFAILRSKAANQPGNIGNIALPAAFTITVPFFVWDSSLTYENNNSVSRRAEIRLHPSIENFVEDYHEKNYLLFEKLKQNNFHYLNTIDKIFFRHDLPVQLKYMAVVESKLKPGALSPVGAAGLWQFMPATAKKYGLKVSAGIDERKNAWKSTVAAARYLKKLYSLFGDWLLVIAAYNSGPAPVYKAIKKSGSRNFWQLQYFLPKESRVHVKKFIATHYYFEGKGSLVTLGKNETEDYLKKEIHFAESLIATEVKSDSSIIPFFDCTVPKRFVAVIREERQLMMLVKK